MKFERFDNPAAFGERAIPYLLHREAEHNLMLGLIHRAQHHPELLAEPPYMATVSDGEEVVAVSIRTPPLNILLSHIAPEHLTAVCDLLAADYHVTYGDIPGVLGRKDLVHHFAARWQAQTGQRHETEMAQRIYRLTQVTPVEGVNGTYRPAEEADRERYAQWAIAFQREALHENLPLDEARGRFDRYLLPDRELLLWEVDGQPVAMAGVAGVSINGVRIGPVYTPPEYRKRGYGSAVTAALSQRQLDSGRKFCFLYTDLGNPTSNRIYQDIGYVPVCDVDMLRFATL